MTCCPDVRVSEQAGDARCLEWWHAKHRREFALYAGKMSLFWIWRSFMPALAKVCTTGSDAFFGMKSPAMKLVVSIRTWLCMCGAKGLGLLMIYAGDALLDSRLAVQGNTVFLILAIAGLRVRSLQKAVFFWTNLSAMQYMVAF